MGFSERLRKFRETENIVNWHEHIWYKQAEEIDIPRFEAMLRDGEEFGISQFVISNPAIGVRETKEQIMHRNDTVYWAMRNYPGKVFGMCYVDPGLTRFSLEEIDRCVGQLGFVGIKLYNQYFISDPVLDEVLEKAKEYGVPVLEHAAKLNMFAETQPFASDGTHFAKAAEKHPDTQMILAHIGGGGDWQWQIRAIEDYPNVAVDMSGSIHDLGMLEYAVEHLGASRILFGSDGSIGSCVGKITGSNLSDADKRTILTGAAFQKYLVGKEAET